MKTIEEVRKAKEDFLYFYGKKLPINGIGVAKDKKGFYLKLNLISASTVEIPTEIDDVRIITKVVGDLKKR